MKLSYNKLCKLLIDKDLIKTKLREMSGISYSSMAKLINCGNVITEVLIKIYSFLYYDISDITEIVKEN